jgi:hypothetical protein
LLHNTHVHLELHLHELIPVLITCVVAKRLSTTTAMDSINQNHAQYRMPPMIENHWAFRREAARALVAVCQLYGDEYSTLKARVLRSLCQTLHPLQAQAQQQQQQQQYLHDEITSSHPNGRFLSNNNSVAMLASRYGGLVTMIQFGGKAIDAFVLPVAAMYWQEWMHLLCFDKDLSSSSPSSSPSLASSSLSKPRNLDYRTHLEIRMCLRALLDAIGIWLRSVDDTSKATRITWHQLENIFGSDRLVCVQNITTEYATCIV